MTDLNNLQVNGQSYCPFGASQSVALGCSGTVDILSVLGLAAVFPEGIPEFLEELVGGISIGTVVTSVLCATVPGVPQPWNPAWWNPLELNANKGLIVDWIVNALWLFAWTQCCQCNPPMAPGYQLIRALTFPAAGGGADFFPSPDATQTWSTKMVVVCNSESISTNAVHVYGQVGTVSGSTGLCDGAYSPTDSIGDVCVGSSSGYCGTPVAGFGDEAVDEEVLHTSGAAAACWFVSMAPDGGGSGSSECQVWVYAFPNGPISVAMPTPPSIVTPAPTEPPTGFPDLGAQGNGVGSCNFGATSAMNIEQVYVPQDVEIVSSDAISGIGHIAIPAGCQGFMATATTVPPAAGRAASDPPYYYQGGYVSWGNGAPAERLYLGYSPAMWWGIRPDASELWYNIPDGWEWSIEWYQAGTPT